jgi:hypothetical protein
MITPVIQLDDFRKAIRLLGGGRATADALGVSDRHIRHVLAGKRELHAGILADVDDALARRANDRRDLRRRLSPVFERNLTSEQSERPIHGNSAHARQAAGEGRHGQHPIAALTGHSPESINMMLKVYGPVDPTITAATPAAALPKPGPMVVTAKET